LLVLHRVHDPADAPDCDSQASEDRSELLEESARAMLAESLGRERSENGSAEADDTPDEAE